jgi:hypothetical protein
MMSWWNEIFPKRPDVKPTSHVVLSAESLVVTAASTSANVVIRELTKEFTKEIKEKAEKLDITLE